MSFPLADEAGDTVIEAILVLVLIPAAAGLIALLVIIRKRGRTEASATF